MSFSEWIIIPKNESLFSGITAIIMIFLAGVAVIVAIIIAYRQYTLSKRDHLNNLAFEIAIDFICPFNNYADKVNVFLETTKNAKGDEEIIKSLLGILDKVNLCTDFKYWEIHKGDINDALVKKCTNEHAFAEINQFIIAARKHREDIYNIRKEMRDYLNEILKKPQMASVVVDQDYFIFSYSEINEHGRKLIDDMKDLIDKLPDELCIEKICKEIKSV